MSDRMSKSRLALGQSLGSRKKGRLDMKAGILALVVTAAIGGCLTPPTSTSEQDSVNPESTCSMIRCVPGRPGETSEWEKNDMCAAACHTSAICVPYADDSIYSDCGACFRNEFPDVAWCNSHCDCGEPIVRTHCEVLMVAIDRSPSAITD